MLSVAKATRSVVNGVLLVLPANTRGGGKGCVTRTVNTEGGHQKGVTSGEGDCQKGEGGWVAKGEMTRG